MIRSLLFLSQQGLLMLAALTVTSALAAEFETHVFT